MTGLTAYRHPERGIVLEDHRKRTARLILDTGNMYDSLEKAGYRVTGEPQYQYWNGETTWYYPVAPSGVRYVTRKGRGLAS